MEVANDFLLNTGTSVDGQGGQLLADGVDGQDGADDDNGQDSDGADGVDGQDGVN